MKCIKEQDARVVYGQQFTTLAKCLV